MILTGALTLLSLVIGFTFSMAGTRYDERLKYEAEEANAINTALLRAHFLPAADAIRLRDLLVNYARQRVSFYSARDTRQWQEAQAATARIKADLWSTVQACAQAQPTPITALAVSAVTDVFDAQGTSEAVLADRIPTAAWTLIGTIAVFSNLLIGYTSRRVEDRKSRLLILPILVSCSLALIADLGDPYSGVIHTVPRDLIKIAHSI